MDEENIIPAPSASEPAGKQNFFLEYRNLIVVGGLVVTVAVVFLMSMLFSSRQIAIGKPDKTVSIKAGDTYTITWGSKGVSSIGIVLFNGNTLQWIAKGVAANKGKYDWTVIDNQPSGSNYRLAVFQYPWRNGNAISYTQSAIQIVGPQFISCNDLAVKAEWPYVPGDYPNAKRLFISDGQWTGNLGGIEGADAKCQQEADNKKIEGKFIAFLGTDTVAAKDRLAANGVFVLTTNSQVMPDGQTCYRLVGRDADSLLNKAILAGDQISVELDNDFARQSSGVWYGRRTAASKADCLELTGMGVSSAFSSTYTCQNWTKGDGQVYQGTIPPDADLPKCYDQQGNSVFANYLAGNASATATDDKLVVVGSLCSRYNHLLCVEQ